MKNIVLFCSLIALLCVSTASVFHIILSKMQIDEIVLAKQKRMKLNAYFRNELAHINCRHRKLERAASNDKPSYWRDVDFLNKDEDRVNEEMKRCEYTTLEIDRLKMGANSFGYTYFILSNEKEYRKEQKEFGYSDEEIERDVKEALSLMIEFVKPFSLD